MSAPTTQLRVRIFDGSRREFAQDKPVLITIHDGDNREVFRAEKPSGTVFRMPFHNNFVDNHTVVAFCDGYQQAGFTPVKCLPGMVQAVDLMLLKRDTSFNFAAGRWENLQILNKSIYDLLRSAPESGVDPKDRYGELIERRPEVLACFFNICTAMAGLRLPQATALSYFKEIIWETAAQDRFFAYADAGLYDQVKLAAHQGGFEREPGFAAFHHGATDSYKQVQFGEANLQLTFHGNDTKVISGIKCIKMEPDIDYYRDLAAHGLLEVVVNGFSHTLTDPRQVYVLRWIAGRHAGVPEFEPPYTIV